MRTSALFFAKTNIEFFKIYSMSTSDIDRVEGRGIETVLTFVWTRGGQFFMILCRHRLWMNPEQKTAKLSMGYDRPTNCNS